MRISDWSSDVLLFRSHLRNARSDGVGQDLRPGQRPRSKTALQPSRVGVRRRLHMGIRRGGSRGLARAHRQARCRGLRLLLRRSEEHTSELQSLMRISYAVFCLKQKKKQISTNKK